MSEMETESETEPETNLDNGEEYTESECDEGDSDNSEDSVQE